MFACAFVFFDLLSYWFGMALLFIISRLFSLWVDFISFFLVYITLLIEAESTYSTLVAEHIDSYTLFSLDVPVARKHGTSV
jgi:hypothetical protein